MEVYQKKIKAICVAIVSTVLCFSISGCNWLGSKSFDSSSAMSTDKNPLADVTDTIGDYSEVNMSAQNPGEYVSQQFSLAYPQDVIHLEEQEVSDDGEAFLISLTKKGEDIGSIPRIDIISVDASGLTEDALRELSDSDAEQAFEFFAASLLTAYYNLQFDEAGNVVGGTAPTMEFQDTTVQVTGEEKFCETKVNISETDDLPAMQATIRLQGKAENGLVSVIFVQSSLDEESKAVLCDIVESIQLR